MEQGRLLFALTAHAQAFNTMQDANTDILQRLAIARKQREQLGQTLIDTKAHLVVYEEQAAANLEEALSERESELVLKSMLRERRLLRRCSSSSAPKIHSEH